MSQESPLVKPSVSNRKETTTTWAYSAADIAQLIRNDLGAQDIEIDFECSTDYLYQVIATQRTVEVD